MEGQTNKQETVPAKKLSLRQVVILIVALLVIAGGAFLLLSQKTSAPTNTGSATLSWNANTEPDLAGYKIYYGISLRNADCPPAGYPNKIDVGKTDTPDEPSYTITSLENGKTFYFSVTSYDTSGNESCFSAEMSKIIQK